MSRFTLYRPFNSIIKLCCVLVTVLMSSSCRQSDRNIDNHLSAWYKTAIIYNLDVKTFQDSNGDGIGDFNGLTSRLGYLDSLGINTLWLAPFQPSTWQDDGYDVTDYYTIDKRLGSERDFKRFLQVAKLHHFHVLMDMVLNHTSINHPWFRDRENWYVRSVKRPDDWNKGMGFPGTEKDTWHPDSIHGGYYFHRFYHFEPDLDYQNPAVLSEAKQILTYWLKLGVDGFRLDAVPFIIADPRPSAEDPVHHFTILNQLAQVAHQAKPEVALLGEANIKPNEANDYFSHHGEGLDMMINFEVNEYLFYALATSDTRLLQKALKVTSTKPAQDQWVYFLRNHDEIDLGKLSGKERQTAFAELGPDTTMQLYKRGIRRRFAPMMHNNLQRLKQANALLFALPGTPVLRYGEEIGMGDNLHLKERLAIRTPMQWNNQPQAGFTNAVAFRPVIDTGIFGYPRVNVHDQQQSAGSLLNVIRQLVRLRKAHPEIAQGYWSLPSCSNIHCLLIQYHGKTGNWYAVFNFAGKSQKLELPDQASIYTDLISGQRLTADNKSIDLPPNAGYWLQPVIK